MLHRVGLQWDVLATQVREHALAGARLLRVLCRFPLAVLRMVRDQALAPFALSTLINGGLYYLLIDILELFHQLQLVHGWLLGVLSQLAEFSELAQHLFFLFVQGQRLLLD